MRGDHHDPDLVFAGLHLLDLHPFRKREQRVSFHHGLVSSGKTVKPVLQEASVSYPPSGFSLSFVGDPAAPVLAL